MLSACDINESIFLVLLLKMVNSKTSSNFLTAG